MRRLLWSAAVAVSLGLVSQASAQHAVGFGGVNPKDVTFTPLDTSRVIAAPIPAPPRSSGFSLKSLIPSFSWPSFLGGKKNTVMVPAVPPKPTSRQVITSN